MDRHANDSNMGAESSPAWSRSWQALPKASTSMDSSSRARRDRNFRSALIGDNDDSSETDDVEPMPILASSPEGSCHCCGGCCQRCLAHFWFFAICFGYILMSSLPRILVTSDAALSLIVYLVAMPSKATSLEDFLRQDVLEFSFASSAIDLVLLSILRSAILFVCFAYRNQTSPRSLMTSRAIGSTSMLYMVTKLTFAHARVHWLLMWSIFIVIAEFVVFWSVRRRRIMAPSDGRIDYQRIAGNSARSISIASNSEVHLDVPEVANADNGDNDEPQFKQIRGVNVHYRLHINEDSPLVICLVHGFGGGLFSFRQIWPLLTERATVIAFDRPGHGLSQPCTDLCMDEEPVDEVTLFTSDFCVSVLDDLLSSMGLAQCVFVGHSSGAGIAALMSVLYPQRVQALCLAAFSQGLPAFLRSIFQTKLGRAVIIQLTHSELGNVALRRSWHNPDAIDGAIVQRYKSVLAGHRFVESLFSMAQASAKEKSIKDICHAVDCPVLLVDGDDDKLVVESELRRVREYLRHCHPVHTIVPKCGHLPHEETPRSFANIVIRFAERIQQQK